MGQKIGKVRLIPEAEPFSNVSGRGCASLWNRFNDVAEGFGIGLDVFTSICSVLKHELSQGDEPLPPDELNAMCRAVFQALDTDQNDLIDALEFLATFALISSLSWEEKVRFAFDCYDFDESGQLTIDEMTLSLKSTITGLAKLAGVDPPSESQLEDISQDAFRKADKAADEKISFEEFLSYCRRNADVRSWVDFFEDPGEAWQSYADDDDDRHWRHEYADIAWHPPVEDPVPPAYLAGRPEPGAPVAPEPPHAPVRPWVGMVLPPTDAPAPVFAAPEAMMQLKWVYGYRGQDARQNLFYTKDGDIVYPAASMGIVYNTTRHVQKYASDHGGDIVSLALHPNGELVATGERAASKPRIVVWDTQSMERRRVIRGFHQTAVTCLDFSATGRWLLTAGADKYHSVALYDWDRPGERGPVFAARTDPQSLLDCRFILLGGPFSSGPEHKRPLAFATVGVQHVSFWMQRLDKDSSGGGPSAAQMATMKAGKDTGEAGGKRVFQRKRGLFGRKFEMQTLTCVAHVPNNPGKTVTGTKSGEIYLWQGRKCGASYLAHEGSVSCLYGCPRGLLSGGEDGKVLLWSVQEEGTEGMCRLATFDMASIVTQSFVSCSVRSVCWSADTTRLLVGTEGSEVYELSVSDGSDVNGGPVVQGHCSEELWGLALHPSKVEFATVGDDCTLRIWDCVSRRQLRSAPLGAPARTVAFSPDGTMVVVGFGSWDARPYRGPGAGGRKPKAYQEARGAAAFAAGKDGGGGKSGGGGGGGGRTASRAASRSSTRKT
eukprot:g1903.t1